MAPMRHEEYEELRCALCLPFGTCVNMKNLGCRFPGVPTETLISIYAQEQQYKVIRSNHVHKNRILEYWDWYVEGTDLLQLCADVDFPPCMMVRRLLEAALRISKQAIGDILREPARLPAAVHAAAAARGGLAGTDGLTPCLLQRLQLDVARCVAADTCYSPLSDMAKQAAGLEFEMLLCQHLSDLGVPFWTEGDLRAMGYFKTPDVWLHVANNEPGGGRRMHAHGRGDRRAASVVHALLNGCLLFPVARGTRAQVPMGVRDPDTSTWRVVSWIDSKATFGDARVHERQSDEQYHTYTNRYGGGLVIYWFGCVEGLGARDSQVMVLDHFPHKQDVRVLRSLRDPDRDAVGQSTAGSRPLSVDGAGVNGSTTAGCSSRRDERDAGSRCSIGPADRTGQSRQGAEQLPSAWAGRQGATRQIGKGGFMAREQPPPGVIDGARDPAEGRSMEREERPEG